MICRLLYTLWEHILRNWIQPEKKDIFSVVGGVLDLK